ncbi:MAG: hypothetical protein OEU78_07470 [Gammaproteobacteria bacterium]|jgi:hypothetical protein|nr:hypothetical protein [Gammaproteobacteria bacterium]
MATPNLWGSMVTVSDMQNRQVLAENKMLRPQPGKASAHLEFSRDRRYALISLSQPEGLGWCLMRPYRSR